jgi:hypothetical protein
MKSNHVYNKMLFLLNGELSEIERKQTEEHLTTCSECSIAYERLTITMSLIDEEKKLEPGPYLFSKIQNRIDALNESNEIIYRKPSVISILKPVYISLLILFAVFTGMLVGSNLNISYKSTKNTNAYTVNTTKDFYILGLDGEGN